MRTIQHYRITHNKFHHNRIHRIIQLNNFTVHFVKNNYKFIAYIEIPKCNKFYEKSYDMANNMIHYPIFVYSSPGHLNQYTGDHWVLGVGYYQFPTLLEIVKCTIKKIDHNI